MNFFSATTRQLQQASEPPAADVGGVIDRASTSIGAIVDAAERAATEIRAEVAATLETQTEGPPAGREQLVAELAIALADRAEALSREARELAEVLERAGSRLAAPVPTTPLEAPEEARSDDSNARRADAIRLVATQMAVAGSSREQIAARLEQEFGIENPGAGFTGAPAEPSGRPGGEVG